MGKRKRILSLVLVLAMLFSMDVPVQVRAEEAQYTYMSSQEMYNWLSAQRGSAIRPQNLGQAQYCINDFYPEPWVPGESKESVFQQIVGLTDSLVSGKAGETEKARAIFDWVSQNIAYDHTAYGYSLKWKDGTTPTEEEMTRYTQAGDAFYTFYNRRAVCDGYAQLSWLMYTIAGIPAAHIVGNSHGTNVAHAWNAVYCDGRWILLDATWSIWDMTPDYHQTGSILFSDGAFCRGLSCDGAVWYWAFQGYPCPADVTIPVGVVEINMDSFKNCAGMTSLTIPEGVRMIGVSAFENCTGLTSVAIPASVTTIRRDAFKGCTNLSSITFLGSMPVIENGAFDGTAWQAMQGDFAITGSILMKYNGFDEEVVIPSGVTAIADAAFRSNFMIKRVVIPEGVTSIGKNAFSNCSFLTDVSIPASVNTIGYHAFEYTPWLKNQREDFVVVNDILIKYQGPDVRNIVIPNGVRTTAAYAFYEARSARSVTIPASVTRIDEWMFNHSYIEEVNYGGTREQWDAVNIVRNACTNWKLRDETTAIHYNYPYAGF